MQSLVYGLNAIDPVSLAASAVLLLAVAVAACLAPAWRASRVDPVTVLRAE
jgi:ABC-type lipoprotein release transport system permease subunit